MRATILGLPVVLLTGCVIGPGELDQLPAGVTLLDSGQAQCAGPIEIESDPDLTLDDGESVTLAIDEHDDLEWACIDGGLARNEEEFQCPSETDYLRVIREAGEAAFTVECFDA